MNHYLRHWLSYLLLTVMLVSATDFDAVAQRRRQSNNKPRTSATIKKEQKRVNENLKSTSRKIEANRSSTLQSLNQLDLLNADIDMLNADLRRLQATVDSATTAAALMSDTLRILSSRLDGIKQAYTKSVRATQSAAGSH
ncbi:MAG: hypothetical protein K2M98_02155, partial [Muribaculum sp.]|nr:hypothetical protein [Muribaculum sp.]